MTLTASTPRSRSARLSPQARQRCADIAHQILQRIGDTALLEGHVARSMEQSDHGGWHVATLAQGHAGLALAHAVLSGAHYDHTVAVAHRDSASLYLRAAVEGTADDPLHTPSLCSGTAGLVLAAEVCVSAEPRFAPALTGLRSSFLNQVAEHPALEVQAEITDLDYDFMSGRAGVLAYAAQPQAQDSDAATALPAVSRLIEDLVWAGSRDSNEPHLWRWMINRDTAVSLSLQDESFPDNFLNLSVSHGLAAISGSLAMAAVNDQRQIQRVAPLLEMHADWLVRRAERDAEGALVWPTGYSVDAAGVEHRHGEANLASTWCYGGAGIAMALDNIAVALNDAKLAKLASASMRQHLQRALDWSSPVANLCHGAAGNVLLTMELASRLGDDTYDQALEEQVVALIGRADSNLPLLYDDLESGTTRVDQPGLLNGASGVALVLATAAAPNRPAWANTWMMSPASGAAGE
ncbi:lanthionine synthetase LanC family protein [Microbacterium sp. NPDC087589]|uniref:lanthionine synthetase LanC family protein n=1 Tax=Microbacterium sp. NPDC087589 TaxID=3364191 RepID=UPI00380D463D